MRRESEVRDALEAQKKKVLELKNAHDEAANLSNDVITAQRDLDAVTQRLAQSKLESLAQKTNVVLLALAVEPLDRSSPKESMFMAAGVFLGLVLGIGAVLLMEMWDKRLRAEEDLVRLLGVPVLGRIKTLKPGSDLPVTG
jgi:capsular polysaccharide biosynthesis protein